MLTACSTERSEVQTVTTKPVEIEAVEGSYTFKGSEETVINSVKRLNRVPMQSAYLTTSGDFVPSEEGNLVDYTRLSDDIRKGLKFFNIEDYYINEEDPEEEKLYALSQSINSFHITYTNGETITKDDIGIIVSPFGDYTVDKDRIYERVKDISLMYDTVGKSSIDYTTHAGDVVHVTGGSWGTLSSTAKEQEYIYELVQNLMSEEDRVPILKEECKTEIPSRVIEVDRSAQTLYVVENGKAISQTPVVTGNASKHQTPSGVYKVLERRKEKDLRGPGYVSHVHRWMRLTWSGIGLHDATWRSNFGGNIYLRNGSHGCVNLPAQYAYDLYDKVSVGDCVIVY